MLENFQTNVQPNQVQILCLDAHADTLRECRVQPWAVGTAPLYLFVLVNQHWTFVTRFVSAGRLAVQQLDGLTHTPLCALAPLCHRLKAAWQVESVTLTTSWRIEQTKTTSCGTIAFGRFALELGMISFEQAMHFGALHNSFAVCSNLLGMCRMHGFASGQSGLVTKSEYSPFPEAAFELGSAIRPTGVSPLGEFSAFSHSGLSLPLLLHYGLSTGSIKRLAAALMSQNTSVLAEHAFQVVCATPSGELDGLSVESLHGNRFLWIFLLAAQHWTLICCQVSDMQLHLTQFDGLHPMSHANLGLLEASLSGVWKFDESHCSAKMFFRQTKAASCGTVALAHFAYLTGTASFAQAGSFETLHDVFVRYGFDLALGGPIGYGAEEAAIIGTLEQILPSQQVPVEEVPQRAISAIKAFGLKALQQALKSANQWAALKTLGNSRPRPFMWVAHQELQTHIQERAQSKFGAVGLRKPRKKQVRREPTLPKNLDPARLLLPPGLFTTNCGTALRQLAIGMYNVMPEAWPLPPHRKHSTSCKMES